MSMAPSRLTIDTPFLIMLLVATLGLGMFIGVFIGMWLMLIYK